MVASGTVFSPSVEWTGFGPRIIKWLKNWHLVEPFIKKVWEQWNAVMVSQRGTVIKDMVMDEILMFQDCFGIRLSERPQSASSALGRPRK